MARGKMKTLYGLYKHMGREAFLEAARGYSIYVRGSVENTIGEMECHWYDAEHTITEAEKMVADYNDGVLIVPQNTEHPRLIGYSSNGTFPLESVQEVAEFICREGVHGDLTIRTRTGDFFLSTFGTFIDRMADIDYRQKLLEVLIPMQMAQENVSEEIKM